MSRGKKHVAVLAAHEALGLLVYFREELLRHVRGVGPTKVCRAALYNSYIKAEQHAA